MAIVKTKRWKTSITPLLVLTLAGSAFGADLVVVDSNNSVVGPVVSVLESDVVIILLKSPSGTTYLLRVEEHGLHGRNDDLHFFKRGCIGVPHIRLQSRIAMYGAVNDGRIWAPVGGFLDDVAQSFFLSRLGSSGNCEETLTNGWAIVAEDAGPVDFTPPFRLSSHGQ